MSRAVFIALIVVVSCISLIIAGLATGSVRQQSEREQDGPPQVGIWKTEGGTFRPQHTTSAEFTHTETGKRYLVIIHEGTGARAMAVIEIKP